jgi:hypothetical protein
LNGCEDIPEDIVLYCDYGCMLACYKPILGYIMPPPNGLDVLKLELIIGFGCIIGFICYPICYYGGIML